MACVCSTTCRFFTCFIWWPGLATGAFCIFLQPFWEPTLRALFSSCLVASAPSAGTDAMRRCVGFWVTAPSPGCTGRLRRPFGPRLLLCMRARAPGLDGWFPLTPHLHNDSSQLVGVSRRLRHCWSATCAASRCLLHALSVLILVPWEQWALALPIHVVDPRPS